MYILLFQFSISSLLFFHGFAEGDQHIFILFIRGFWGARGIQMDSDRYSASDAQPHDTTIPNTDAKNASHRHENDLMQCQCSQD